ncbi:MAG TPA: PhnD/SsuA/transferrin family substrate-binding protein [Ramlibacter sp.]|nr:PhnD/SsuA/transferrin family substrate-binding protein [Ramlibacter sp.]
MTHRSTLRVASCMAPNADAMCRDLAQWLGARLAIDVEFIHQVSWQERECRLTAGLLDLCWICSPPMLRMVDAGVAVEPCVAPVMAAARYGRRPVYFSDVVVRADSAHRSFADLRGQSWAYNERGSHSGWGVVCYHLATLGSDMRYFGRVVEAGSHQAALRMIASGAVTAAAIDSTVLEAESAQHPQVRDMFRVVATLGPSPAPPWVMSSRLPHAMKLAIRDALAAMRHDAQGRDILGSWGIEALAPVDLRDYEATRHMMRLGDAYVPDAW